MSLPSPIAILETFKRAWGDLGPRYKKVILSGGYLICLAMLAWAADETALQVDISRIRPAYLVVSLLFGCIYFLSQGIAWGDLSSADSKVRALSNWSRTQALHFLPGGVFTPASRAMTVTGKTSRKAAVVAFEAVLGASVVVFVGAVGLATSIDPIWWLATLGGPIGIAAVVVLGKRSSVKPREVMTASCWYFVGRTAFCLAAYFAQFAIRPQGAFWPIIAASASAWLVGYVALFAPGGLGVREVVYISIITLPGIGSHISRGLASSGALSARLTMSVAEILVLGAFGWSTRGRKVVPEDT
ncbi:MAG TPA: hypothetical protein VMU77_01270 [Acidimicrobiales bacterium]|nr:hypothetical protein [Acidimicrobiales bacterium]